MPFCMRNKWQTAKAQQCEKKCRGHAHTHTHTHSHTHNTHQSFKLPQCIARRKRESEREREAGKIYGVLFKNLLPSPLLFSLFSCAFYLPAL